MSPEICPHPQCSDGWLIDPETPENSGPCPLCAKRHEAEAIARALEEPALHQPGVWVCPKCGFELVKRTIHPNGITVNDEEQYEICPNDMERMRRCSWEYSARTLSRMAERVLMENQQLRSIIEATRDGRIEDLIREFSTDPARVQHSLAMLKVGVEKKDKPEFWMSAIVADALLSFFGQPPQ